MAALPLKFGDLGMTRLAQQPKIHGVIEASLRQGDTMVQFIRARAQRFQMVPNILNN